MALEDFVFLETDMSANSSKSAKEIFLTECPRDAMQGWKAPIPTAQKIAYLNALLEVGYDVLDAGSFVSPKAIPQMADTAEVLHSINRENSQTKISVIVANISGAESAAQHENADILAFPFSISEQFQQRNTHKGRESALEQMRDIAEICRKAEKDFWVYFSMAFGNPYEEPHSQEMVIDYAERCRAHGISHILISDTTGLADAQAITDTFRSLHQNFPDMTFAAHFHNPVQESYIKLKAAWEGGCRHFDSAIKGIGGCPFAKDELIGNMPTEQVINFMAKEHIQNPLNMFAFESAYNKAKDIFQF